MGMITAKLKDADFDLHCASLTAQVCVSSNAPVSSSIKWICWWEKIKTMTNRAFDWCFSRTSIKNLFFSARGIFFVKSVFWDSVYQTVLVLQNISLVMYSKMDFGETTQLAYESSFIFKRMFKMGKTWISSMIAIVTRLKYLETSPSSYIVITPNVLFHDFKDHVLTHQISLNN